MRAGTINCESNLPGLTSPESVHQSQLRELVKLYTKMSLQSSLRVCATEGNMSDTIAVIRCSSMFNMRNVIYSNSRVTLASLWVWNHFSRSLH